MRFAEINNPISAVSYANINPMLAIRNIEQHDQATNDVLTEENKTYNSILNDGTLDPDTKQARLKAVRDNLNQIHAQFQGNLGAARPAILAYTQKEMTDPYWQTDKQLFEKYKNFQDTVSKGKAEGHDFYYEDENGQTVSNPNDMFRPYDNMGNLRNPASVNVNPVKVLNAYTAAEHMFDSLGDNISESYVPGKDALADYFVAKKNKNNINQIAALEKNAVDIFSMTPEGQQYRKHNGYEKTANLLHNIAQSKIVKEQTQKIEIDQAKQNELNRQNDIEKAEAKDKKDGKENTYDFNTKSQASATAPKTYAPHSPEKAAILAKGMTNAPAEVAVDYINRRKYLNESGESSNIELGGNDATANNKIMKGLYNTIGYTSAKLKEGEEFTYGKPSITRGGQLRIPTKTGYQVVSPEGHIERYKADGTQDGVKDPSGHKDLDETIASNLKIIRQLNAFKYGVTKKDAQGNPIEGSEYKLYKSKPMRVIQKMDQNGTPYTLTDYTLTHSVGYGDDGKLQDFAIEEFTNPINGEKVKRPVPIGKLIYTAQQDILSQFLNSKN